MLPVRCFTCNALIGHMWHDYSVMRQNASGKECLDHFKLKSVCCRRMLLTHVPVIDDIMMYSNIDHKVDDCNTTFKCFVAQERTVQCR